MKGSVSSPRRPPTVSYETFEESIEYFTANGPPRVLERTSFGPFDAPVAARLISAYAYLGFIDERNAPTELFRAYVSADTSQRRHIMASILFRKYARQVRQLSHGTPESMLRVFLNIPSPEHEKKQAIAFFLNAARFASLPLSPRFRERNPSGGHDEPAFPSSISSEVDRRELAKVRDSVQAQIREAAERSTGDGPVSVSIPVPLRVGKTWEVIIDSDYSRVDVENFLEIIQIVLLGDSPSAAGKAAHTG